MAGTRGRPNAAQMSKRILGGVLWFLAASYAWSFVSAMTGVLPVAALPIGILVGTFVIADPLRTLWADSRRTSAASHADRASAANASLTPQPKA